MAFIVQVSLELLRSVLTKESALNDLDCVDRLLGMIAPILKDPPPNGGDVDDGDAAMQVRLGTGFGKARHQPGDTGVHNVCVAWHRMVGIHGIGIVIFG